ncbi:MAG: serine/threonine protein kinase, partial [Planctomycetes bacterium]|nr:serine/threonine protein kinase [Planctomycetota bacterium]
MIQTADEFNDNRDEEYRSLYAAAYEAQQEEQADDAGLQSIRESLSGYTVFNAIGAGGQGRVYSGVRESTNQSVAIKVLNGGAFSSRREMKRFWREIAILRRLKHPGIVNIYDSGTINRAPYLVMERIVGVQIDCIAITTGMNLRQRIELFLQACAAVSAAHAQGIIHRDLKPANILVESVFDDDDDDKEEMFVRLLDFGLAKDMSEDHPASSSNLSMTGCRVGTARYSSPEQIKGRPVDVQTDIYSLGVVLFELLSGQLPYIQNDKEYGDVAMVMHGRRRGLRDAIKATNVLNPALCPYSPKEVGRDLETILDTATTVEPDLRYATVDEFADDLRRYLDGKSINAQISVVRRIRARSKAYRRKFAAAAGIALVATSFSIGMFSWYNARESETRSQKMATTAQAALFIASFVKQATAYHDKHEPDQAIETLEQAVELAELAPAEHPLLRRQVYQAYHNLATYYLIANRPEDAGPYCNKAVELSEALQQDDPDNLEWMRLGSYSRWLSGRAAFARAEWKEAQ